MPAPPGDSGASQADLRVWLQTHGDRLLRSAYLLCGDAMEAQDLVQETLLQATTSAHRFRGDSAIYTWLHGILLNLSRRHWRKQKRLVFDEARILSTTMSTETAESQDDHDFRLGRLARAIRNLSPEHREVVVLRFYEELKIHEIAAQLGASAGTVKSRLHYALRHLETLLPDELNPFAGQGTHKQQ